MKAITQKEQKKLLSHLVITVYANHTKSGILQDCKRCKIIFEFLRQNSSMQLCEN